MVASDCANRTYLAWALTGEYRFWYIRCAAVVRTAAPSVSQRRSCAAWRSRSGSPGGMMAAAPCSRTTLSVMPPSSTAAMIGRRLLVYDVSFDGMLISRTPGFSFSRSASAAARAYG
ncbi:hypothetical protein BC477_14460 [Clavibacter michiganensis subsp. michiganensis]|nr:hypothetical protein BC477_14460 [Clavibacter michiganensis subsp. michiganensis]